jgi:hypothetical protein
VSRQSIKFATLLIATTLLTSACGIGFNAGTNQQKASGNGRSANVGTIQVRAALIVIDPAKPGLGTFAGTIINSAPEKDKFLGLTLDPTVGNALPANKVLKTQEPAQYGLPGQLSLPLHLTSEVKAGTLINVQLNFQNNEAIPMRLLVENNDGIYSGVVVGFTGG